MNECYRCGLEFSATNPKCTNGNLSCCGNEREVGFAFCVKCCKILWPNAIRHGAPVNRIQCRYCSKAFKPENFACKCCPDSVNKSRYKWCKNCCRDNMHPCCWEQIGFREQLNPFFAFPENKSFPDPHFVYPDQSLLILGGLSNCLSPKGFISNKSRRFASVEIEVASYENCKQLNKALVKWNCAVVRDGSINGARPFEINTSPACGDSLREQLSDICKGLVAANAVVDVSCGLHTHIDCRDFGYQEIQRAVAVYSRLETILFAAMHPSRKDSTYCRPCGEYMSNGILKGVKPDTKTVKQATIKTIYGPESLEDHTVYLRSKTDHYGRIGGGGGERNELRYAAMNLHTYFLRGTVEFRLHHGAIDFNEIYGWAKMLVELFDSIKNTPYAKMQQLLDSDKLKDPKASGLFILGQLVSKESLQYFRNKLELMEEISSREDTAGKLPAELMYGFRSKKAPFMNINDRLEIVE